MQWYTESVVKARKKQTRKVIHHAKKLLIPHKANQYHPHLIRWQGLSIVLAFVLVLQFSYNVLTTGAVQVLGASSDISIVELLEKTNNERQKQGLTPLVLNEKLTEAATLKATDMVENNYWAHTSPTGVSPWKWFDDADYVYSTAGENLAKNYPSASATVAAWMASPAHRENILRSEFRDVGFAVKEGVIDGKSTVLIVAEYGTPIAGVTPLAPSTYAASVNEGGVPILTQVGLFVQSLDPVTIGSLVLLAMVTVVAIITHHYRNRLPKSWRRSWRMHHGAYKAVGVIILMALILLGSGGGQI